MTDPFPSAFRDPGPPARGTDIPGDLTGEVTVHSEDTPVDGARRRRLVLLVVGAGLLVVGGGTAAAVSLFGLPGSAGDSAVVADAGPDPSPSVSLPVTFGGDITAGDGSGIDDGSEVPAVGRNVFAPLVDPDLGSGAGGAGGTAGPEGTDAPTAAPTAAPPPDPVVRTVTVPGPTVTSTQVLAGPTATTTRTVTSTTVAGYEVEVVSVADPASATTGVTFTVDGTTVTVAHTGSFGPAGAFRYTGYDIDEDLVALTNGSVSVTLPVGASIVFP